MTTTNNSDAMFADPPEDGIVHYGPGDRPLCGKESPFAEDLQVPRTLPSLPAGDHRHRLRRVEASGGPALTAGSPDGSSCIPTAGLYSNPTSQPAIQPSSFPW